MARYVVVLAEDERELLGAALVRRMGTNDPEAGAAARLARRLLNLLTEDEALYRLSVALRAHVPDVHPGDESDYTEDETIEAANDAARAAVAALQTPSDESERHG